MPSLICEQRKCHSLFRLTRQTQVIRSKYAKPEWLHLLRDHFHQSSILDATATCNVLSFSSGKRRLQLLHRDRLTKRSADRPRCEFGRRSQNICLVGSWATPAQKLRNELPSKLFPACALGWLQTKKTMFQCASER